MNTLIISCLLLVSNQVFARSMSGTHMAVVEDFMDAQGRITSENYRHYVKTSKGQMIELDQEDKATQSFLKEIIGREGFSFDGSIVDQKLRIQDLSDKGELKPTFRDKLREVREKAKPTESATRLQTEDRPLSESDSTEDTTFATSDGDTDVQSADETTASTTPVGARVMENDNLVEILPVPGLGITSDFPPIDIVFNNPTVNVNVGFIRVHFTTNTEEVMSTFSQDIVDERLFSHAHSVQNLFHVSSFGQINLVKPTEDNGEVLIHDAYLDVSSGCDAAEIGTPAFELLTSQGVDLNQYDIKIYMYKRAEGSNCTGPISWSGFGCSLGSSCSLHLGVNNSATFAHEIGHALGLHHANAFNDEGDDEYYDRSDMMGGAMYLRQFNAANLDQLGLLDIYPGSVLNIEQSGTYTLSALNQEYVHGQPSIAKLSFANHPKEYFVSIKSLENYDQLHDIYPTTNPYPYSFESGANIHSQSVNCSDCDVSIHSSFLAKILSDGETHTIANNDGDTLATITQLSHVPGISTTLDIQILTEGLCADAADAPISISTQTPFFQLNAENISIGQHTTQFTLQNNNVGSCPPLVVNQALSLESIYSEAQGFGLDLSFANPEDESFELASGESRTVDVIATYSENIPTGIQGLKLTSSGINNGEEFIQDAQSTIMNTEGECTQTTDLSTFTIPEPELTSDIGEWVQVKFQVSNNNDLSCPPRSYVLKVGVEHNEIATQYRIVTLASQETKTVPVWWHNNINPYNFIGPNTAGSVNPFYAELLGVFHAVSPAQRLYILSYQPTENIHCPGDFDNDGTVGINDYTSLLTSYGVADDEVHDMDHDYIVGVKDLAEFFTHFGNTCE